MALVAAKSSAPDATNGGPINGVYIVHMKASPVVSYTGDIHGYNATKPGKGQKIDPLAANTLSYVSYLKGNTTKLFEKSAVTPRFTTIHKSLAVQNAGGVGVVIYNVAAGASLNAVSTLSQRFTSTILMAPLSLPT